MVNVRPAFRDLDYHVLPEGHFDALSRGFGDVDTVQLLWRAERSRRLILVRSILDILESDDALRGPLPPAEEVWRILLDVHEAAPTAFDTVLLHPQLGSWFSYALRRHRGGANSDDPLWVDLGSVHTFAVAAASAAGLPCRTRVPLRRGRVSLPRLGLATFPTAEAWAFAEAEAEASATVGSGPDTGQRRGGPVRLRHRDTLIVVRPTAGETTGEVTTAEATTAGGTTADGWWGLRRVSLGDNPILQVWIDDLDSFRDLADPVPPARLSDSDVDGWRSLLAEAWDVLCRDHADTARAIAAGVVSIVPLPSGEGWGTRSASTGDAFGSVMVSPAPDPHTLAVALVHEFMHIKLGGLIHLVHLVDDRPAAELYAPWRDDPRPVGGLLQGVYAFLGIAAFWREQRYRATDEAARLAQFEYAYARAQTADGLATVVGSGALTPSGERFAAGITDRLRSWQVDAVPADIVALSRTVADTHRAGWRVRHVRPDPRDVGLLVKAWLTDEAPPPATGAATVIGAPDLRWSQGRLGLARRSILAPANPPDPTGGPSWAFRLTDADFLLMAGDFGAAACGFEDAVVQNPSNMDAWAGLSAAVTGTGPVRAAAALSHQPELVRAVYTDLAATDDQLSPIAVAAWIGD